MMSEEQALLGAIEFTRGPMTKIPGWVADNAAICASVLLNTTAGAINGSMLEIGVFAGRFLSLLVLFAQSADELVVGLDPFVHHSENDVRNYISTSLNEINKIQFITKPTLIKGFSSEYNTRSLAEILIKNARFIHIDGSHEFDDVLWDLEQTEPLLMPGGIFLHRRLSYALRCRRHRGDNEICARSPEPNTPYSLGRQQTIFSATPLRAEVSRHP
jgi:hypothetical protein